MDAERVRSLIVAAFPELAGAQVSPFGEGWVNELWLVRRRVRTAKGGAADETSRLDFVFRFPKRAAAAASVRQEMALLRKIGPALPTPVPDYRYVAPDGALDHPLPFGGYPLIPGVPLAEIPAGVSGTLGLSASAPAALARDVGRFLSALHRLPVVMALEAGVPGGSGEAWRRWYDDWYGTTRATILPALGPDELAGVDDLIAGFLRRDENFAFTPVLLHRDLSFDHILVDPATGDLTGIIDFEDAMVGDPAFDFTGLADLEPGAQQAYDGPRDAGFAERIAFYRRMVPIHELSYGLEEGLPDHVAAARERLARSGGRGRLDPR